MERREIKLEKKIEKKFKIKKRLGAEIKEFILGNAG